MCRLLEENNDAVQEQTLNLIRNIGCGRQENIEEVLMVLEVPDSSIFLKSKFK